MGVARRLVIIQDDNTEFIQQGLQFRPGVRVFNENRCFAERGTEVWLTDTRQPCKITDVAEDGVVLMVMGWRNDLVPMFSI